MKNTLILYLSVEIPRGHDAADLHHKWVIRGSVDLSLDDVGGEVECVVYNAVHLGCAADGVGVLHVVRAVHEEIGGVLWGRKKRKKRKRRMKKEIKEMK